jgi:hypothetical protein
MSFKEIVGLFRTIIVMWVCGLPVHAETLSGAVVDPEQRVFAGADVSLLCGRHVETLQTDSQGQFSFTQPSFRKSCKLRASYSGFAMLEVGVGQRRAFVLQLQIDEVKQTVVAEADKLAPMSMASVSLSDEDLREISTDSESLVTYATQVAGDFTGGNQIYVDKMPASHPPPADRIANITVNPDPFSAEYSDLGMAHVEITTKKPDRAFRVTSLGATYGTKAHDGLDSALTSSQTNATLGLAGAIPFLPLAFTANLNYADNHKELPIEAVVPAVPGSSITAASSIEDTIINKYVMLGADYARGDHLHVATSLYVSEGKHPNIGVEGITLPQAGIDRDAHGHELRSTFTLNGPHTVNRGGLTADWGDSSLIANSTAMGVSASGAFVGGGADLSNQSASYTKWTFKDVYQFNLAGRIWTVGGTLTRRADKNTIVPNSLGHIYFNDEADYVQSATTGAAIGTGILTEGQAKLQYTGYTGAPFVESEVLRKARLSIRAGVRADAQTGGDVLFSPRLSAVTLWHGFNFTSGGGMFVRTWTNDIFLNILQKNGQYLQQYLFTNASLAGLTAGGASAEPQIVAQTEPGLVPIRSWMTKVSVSRQMKNFSPGVEYTWTDGTHLLGSQRLAAGTGFTDLLGSNRGLREDQIHVRGQLKLKAGTLIAHYEWIHSRDDTDGPFSYPAFQKNIRAEWGPTTGVAAHNASFTLNSKIKKVCSITLLDNWHSPLPLNYTSGLDPENDGLYTDRAGLPRNSGRGTFYNLTTLYAHRVVPLPKVLQPKGRGIALDLNAQVINLLGNKNYSGFETVLGSPLLGQPIAAAPGRSFVFSINLTR